MDKNLKGKVYKHYVKLWILPYHYPDSDIMIYSTERNFSLDSFH